MGGGLSTRDTTPYKGSGRGDMSYSLNSLKGAIQGIIWGTTLEVIKEDTRSFDYSSYTNNGKGNGNYYPGFRDI